MSPTRGYILCVFPTTKQSNIKLFIIIENLILNIHVIYVLCSPPKLNTKLKLHVCLFAKDFSCNVIQSMSKMASLLLGYFTSTIASYDDYFYCH